MDRKKYTKKINAKRDRVGYISTKDILDLMEEALRECDKCRMESVITRVNAIGGNNSRGVRNV